MKRILSLSLALLVVSAGLLSLTACSSSSSDEEVEVQTTLAAVYTESAVPVEKSSEEILNYFNSLLNSIKTEKPAMYYRFEKNVPNDSLKVTKAGQEEAEEIDSSLSAINDAAKAVKDLMLENIKETSGDIPFGGDNTDVMLVQGESFASKLSVDDIKYAVKKTLENGQYDTALKLISLCAYVLYDTNIYYMDSELESATAAICSHVVVGKTLCAIWCKADSSSESI